MSTEPTQDPTQAPPAADAGPSQDDRNFAMIVHAAGMIPFIGVIVAAVLFNTKKDASPFLLEHLKEGLNFLLTFLIADLVALLVLAFVNGGIGILIWLPVLAAHIGLGIMGSMAAAEGKPYRYVINARFLK